MQSFHTFKRIPTVCKVSDIKTHKDFLPLFPTVTLKGYSPVSDTWRPTVRSSFVLPPVDAQSFVEDQFGAPLLLAKNFVIPDTEAGICLLVFQLLLAFAKFSQSQLVVRATAAGGTSIAEDAESESESESESDDGYDTSGSAPDELKLQQERPIRIQRGSGRVDFVVSSSTDAGRVDRLVVEVKKAVETANIWQTLTEALAVAHEGQIDTLWAALTDLKSWKFFKLAKVQGGAWQVQAAGTFALLNTLDEPPVFQLGTIEIARLLFEALFPDVTGLTGTEIQGHIQDADGSLRRDVASSLVEVKSYVELIRDNARLRAQLEALGVKDEA